MLFTCKEMTLEENWPLCDQMFKLAGQGTLKQPIIIILKDIYLKNQ